MKYTTLIATLLGFIALIVSASASDQKVRDVQFEEMAEELAQATFVGSPTNNDDDSLSAWEIGLIVTTCVFFVVLLILILVMIVLGAGGGRQDKYKTNVHRNENIEGI